MALNFETLEVINLEEEQLIENKEKKEEKGEEKQFEDIRNSVLREMFAVRNTGDIREQLQDIVIKIAGILPSELKTPFSGKSLTFNPKDKNFVFGSKEGRIAICTEKEVIRDKNVGFLGGITSIILQGKSKFIIAACKNGSIKKFNYSSFEICDNFEGHNEQVNDISLSPDEKYLYSVSNDKTVRKWDMTQRNKNSQLYTHNNKVMALDISFDGIFIISCSKDGSVKVYNTSKVEEEISLELDVGLYSAKISPKLKYIAAGAIDGSITLWNFGSWEVAKELYGHTSKIRDMCFTLNEDILVSGSQDTTIRIWNLDFESDEHVLNGHSDTVRSVLISKDQNYIYSLGKDCRLSSWKLPKSGFNRLLKDHTQTIYKLIFTSKGTLISNSDDGRVILWDMQRYEKIQELHHYDGIYALAITPDERFLISCTDNYKMFIWNLSNYQKEKEIDIEENASIRALIVTDENTLITGDMAFRISIWDMKTFAKKKIYRTHQSEVWALALYQKTNLLFSGDDKGKILVHNIRYEIFITELQGHTERIQCLEISRDGCTLISGCRDFSIRIWNLEKQTCMHVITYHTEIVRTIYCTLDGEYFLACSEDKLLSIWSMKNFSLLTAIKTRKLMIAMAISPDEKTIAVSQEKDICMFENPLKAERNFSIYGPSEEGNVYLKYISKITMGQEVEHNPDMDKWLIMPYRINALHIYSYFNLSNHLRLGLAKDGPFFPTKSGETPLSICLDKKFGDCISAIFKVIDRMAKNNIFLFYYFEQSIEALNKSSFSSLDKFYKAILTPAVGKNYPKFCKDSILLPILIRSDFITPNPDNFMVNDSYTLEGKAIIFLRTLVKLNLTPGSTESLKFLESLQDCTDYDTFEAPLIQIILNDKWKKLSWMINIQALVYASYLILMAIYTALYQYNNKFLIAPFATSQMLSIYELYIMMHGRGYYWKSGWNYFDVARMAMMDAYSILVWTDYRDYMESFLACLNFVTWMRGITYFRVFQSMRYLVNLVQEVYKDVIFFLSILFYSTVALALIAFVLVQEPGDDNYFFHAVTQAYQTNLGDYPGIEDYGMYFWLYFFMFTVLNPIIMLNLIINLMGDTFNRVEEQKITADTLELIKMLIEAESLMFWRRNYGKKEYLHICQEEEIKEDSRSKSLRKIYKIKKQILELDQILKDSQVNKQERFQRILHALTCP